MARGGSDLELLVEDREDGRSFRFWLLVTVSFWVATQLAVIAKVASAYPYVVLDDARHYVVWLRRLSEPGIYPNDPIADNFLAVTPWLYKALYWPLGKLGIDALVIHPLVLLPLMAILWSVVCFSFVYRLWHTPAGAAIATLVLSYILIAEPASFGLPRGIEYSGVLLLLLFFLNRYVALTGIAMIAICGLYPTAALVAFPTMALLMLRRNFPYVTNERLAWLTLISAGVGMMVGASLFFLSTGKAGPTMTAEEARHLPNFGPGGRTAYFAPTFTKFYLCNRRAGMLGRCPSGTDAITRLILLLVVVGGGLWLAGSGRASSLFVRFGLPPPDPQLAAVMGALAISGLILFVLAHAVAFQLYLPSRYTRVTLGFDYALVIAIGTAAIVLILVRRIIFLDREGFATIAVAGILVVAYCLFSLEKALRVSFIRTDAPAIYEWLSATPEGTVVAGFTHPVDNVPAFGRRSVFGSLELMVPYKKAYFELISERMTKLAPALYGASAQEFDQTARDLKIDYVLINRDPANELQDLQRWAKNLPQLEPTVKWLKEGGTPFFWALVKSCGSAGTATHVLLSVACLRGESAR